MFSAVGVYPDCSFAGNYISPVWGFLFFSFLGELHIETQSHSDGRTPHGSIETWVQAEGVKGESKIHMGTAADIGTRHRDKRWRLSGGRRQEMYSWLEFHNMRLGGEQVKIQMD